MHDWVVRGALADALVDSFDDDGVLGLDLVHHAFRSPNAFFQQRGKSDVISNKLRENPERTTAEARSWIRGQPSLPQIQDYTRQLGSVAHSIVKQLTKFSVKPGRRSPSRRKKAKEVDFVGTPVAPEAPFAQLIPYEERPNFAFMSLMLREVLAVARGRLEDRHPKAISQSRPLLPHSIHHPLSNTHLAEFIIG
ncbi:hypothetical protein V5O48_019235 [Marasmius crinis-equi]|uniref:Uncharacterized protein n=1 Tax=Marasmius crinis-equi TaxID=585013 RepID=A0ABR3EIY7_9AGAR